MSLCHEPPVPQVAQNYLYIYILAKVANLYDLKICKEGKQHKQGLQMMCLLKQLKYSFFTIWEENKTNF